MPFASGEEKANKEKNNDLNAKERSSSPALTFIILTYNAHDLLRDCLNSVIEECKSLTSTMPVSCRVIVVDNASSDSTSDMVQDEFPHVQMIRNSRNLGAARGFNKGIAEALPYSDVVVIMNSDVIILPGTVGEMLTFLADHKEVYGVSGPLYFPDMTPQPTRTHIVRILPKGKAKQDELKPFRAEFPGTGFAMYRKEAFLKVGGYDENYYFYNEDLDWAVRAKRLRCVFYALPKAGVIHIGAGGRKHNASGILKELYKANLYFYRRHYPRFTWLAYLILKAEIAIRIRSIQKQIRRLPSGERIKDREDEIRIYLEAKERMQEEYRKPSPPQIPRFEA